MKPLPYRAGLPASPRTSRVPAELSQPIATTHDGRDITRPWIADLEEARDPKLAQSADWGVYDRVLLDDQVKSCMEQRIRAVVSCEWDVLPGDEEDERSVAAAEAMKAAILRVGWDRVTEKMLYASLFGYSVAELMWAPVDGLLSWSQIRVRHARRFRYDANRRLRLLTHANRRGELLPDRKFWVVTSGGTDDDETYGRGLAEWLYFPVLFKRNGVRFWNICLDKFSVPTTKGTYPRGSTQADINKLLAALQSIATDSGFVVPEGMQVELLQLAGQQADFAAVCRYMDGAIAKVILSQTMTTDDGASRSQAEVHKGVRNEVVKADADLLTDAFSTGPGAETAGPARWFTDLNFGSDVAAPRVIRVIEEEDDLKTAAETDKILAEGGWVRTEESFKDRYGDGYVRKEAPTPPPVLAQLPDQAPAVPPAAANDTVPAQQRHTAFAEAGAHRDVVDDSVDVLMSDDGWQAAMAPLVTPLIDRLTKAMNPEEVCAILSSEADIDSEGALTELLARAGFASRLDGVTGED